MKNIPIALIEIGGSHDECLLTQMHALRNRSQEVLLITTQEVWERNPAFEALVQEVFLIDGTKERQEVKRVWKKLKESNIQKVVINTAQGKAIRSLCLKALFHPIEFIGIIHTTRMFTESFTQKVISKKIKKYLLLSETLVNKVSPSRGIQLDYFYPIQFHSSSVKVAEEKKIVCIIGGVESRRKDLKGFLRIAEAAPDDVQFFFLGKSDETKEEVQKFLREVKEHRLEERVHTYTTFVSQNEFDAIVQQSSVILPLIHPDTPSAEQYFRNQIPGAMSVALAYKKPLLLHEQYKNWKELKPGAIYYNLETIGDSLKAFDFDLVSIQHKMERAFSLEKQQQRYASFVLD